MSTLLFTHPACLKHDMPPGHPENADRLRIIDETLAQERFMMLGREQAPLADLDIIGLVHPPEYIDQIREAAPREGIIYIDGDTSMSPGSLEASLRSAGGAIAAVDAVLTGATGNAFVSTRPPGHHAEIAKPMGFCFFNNAAIAVRHAQKQYGIDRVAVVDFDVHHGNGTQDIFWADRKVLYCSTHQMPLYPGTGAASERGEHDNIVNVPLMAGDGGQEFREAVEIAILPRLQQFAPELIVISAGFDAHYRDPLANLKLDDQDYAWITRKLMQIADASAGGRVVSVLEGGYDLQALSRSVSAHVGALLGF
ncbi:MAG: histone deacetylase family protein [Xanthobacteraceae bacterium]|nr:MAG: histone deacetylase family protein [Xanthobacteraceae bacterium]